MVFRRPNLVFSRAKHADLKKVLKAYKALKPL
jgi:hypothetical protein